MGEEWRTRLDALRSRSNCRITTRGRRTGKRHTVTIWFAAGTDGEIFLATLRLDRDWPKNLLRNPEIEVAIDDLRLRGEARAVEDPERRQHIERALRSKYLASRVAGWFGFRPEGVFEVTIGGLAGD